MLSLTNRLKLSVNLLRSIDARRDATDDQGIGSTVERVILDRELAELALEVDDNPQSPRAQTCHEYANIQQAVRTACREELRAIV